ncbi:MAG: cell division protein ZapA [Comamonas sp.]|nr:cell division protein ZapA [uncultured Comamonas sp.]
MSQLEIQILHQDYLLTCPDGHEAQLMEAVERVDQQFQQMRDNSKLRSRERVGVLLAVNLAYENLELRHQLQALQQQLATQQGTAPSNDLEIDAQRLNSLELQAAHDLKAADQLLQRLNQVLDSETTITTATNPDETANQESLNVASTASADMETVTANLDNDMHMDLVQPASKIL